MSEHTVKQGDCLLSIGKKYGLAWKKIWEHPNNAELKNKRKNPGTLYPGDVLYIPEKNEKLVVRSSVRSGKRHRFQPQTGVQPAKLRLRLLIDDEPRANEKYTLEIDGELLETEEGTNVFTTDEDGRLEHVISPDVRSGKLIVGENKDEYILNIGYLDPIDEISGIQDRLNNLGFDCGKVDGIDGLKTKAAVKSFQEKYEISENGPGTQTQKKLYEIHGI